MIETEEVLNSLNITTNYKGYKMIVDAVDIMFASAGKGLTAQAIYHQLADKNSVSPSSAERNISTAIVRAWSVAPQRFEKVLGCKEGYSPKTAEFLRLIYEKVRKIRG